MRIVPLILLLVVCASANRATCVLADEREWICDFDKRVGWPVEAMIVLQDVLRAHSANPGFHHMTSAACELADSGDYSWSCTDRLDARASFKVLTIRPTEPHSEFGFEGDMFVMFCLVILMGTCLIGCR
jgi:hypothetical protein